MKAKKKLSKRKIAADFGVDTTRASAGDRDPGSRRAAGRREVASAADLVASRRMKPAFADVI
jgi:hypothetical protein